MFLAALLIGAGLVGLGYGIAKAGASVGDGLKDIGNAIAGVSTVLGRVEAEVQEIIDFLKSLPLEIRGIIDEAFLRQSIADVKSSIQIITPLVADEATVRRNLDQLKQQCNSLIYSVNRIKEFSHGGISGLLNSSGGIAMWAQTFMLIRRVEGTGPTIWDHPFHAENRKMMQAIADTHDRLAPRYEMEAPQLPQQQQVYDYSLSFTPTGIPFQWDYPPFMGPFWKYSVFRWMGPIDFKEGLTDFGYYMMAYLPGYTVTHGTVIESFSDGWQSTISAWNPKISDAQKAELTRALQDAKYLMARKTEIEKYFMMTKNFDQFKKTIEVISKKPPGW